MNKYIKKLFSLKDLRAKINLNSDIQIAKKQIFWRIRNMGQLEIELILMKWWDLNSHNMSMKDLKEFSEEVLEKEIPELNTYFVNYEAAPESMKYISSIQKQILV